MRTNVSLLRGINVSGQKLIKMDQLRALYESLGFSDVRSYIQSGNVVFTCSEVPESMLIERISAAIRETFGHEVTVMLRTTDELQAVLDANPYKQQAADNPKQVHVSFLAEEPEREKVEEIEQAREGDEVVASIGRELYLYLPHGSARTKLNNALIERKLKMPATSRNWRTVTILADMAKSKD